MNHLDAASARLQRGLGEAPSRTRRGLAPLRPLQCVFRALARIFPADNL